MSSTIKKKSKKTDAKDARKPKQKFGDYKPEKKAPVQRRRLPDDADEYAEDYSKLEVAKSKATPVKKKRTKKSKK